MVPQRTAFGIRVEQPDQPRWLFGINKLWVTAIARWHSLAISGSFPREGPVLLVANHVDAFDPFMVGEAVSRVGKRSITMFARSEFFEVPFLGWWLRRSGAISIRRDEADFGALRAAVEELRRGHVVAAFPQATRAFGRQGLFGQIKAGPAYLAAKTGTPVVPAAVLGTGGSILSRGRFEVRFGEPFVVPPLPPRRTESDLDERARLMEERMLDLLPEAYKRDRVAKARPG
ncbi:MAG TPA: lysophospholipid acyltransferase family protein [Chloroflexota bacterium]|nr:lysophospholipid acyltransferase family protein [Chloroflexota bacterium]